MQWYKHDTNASSDAKVRKLLIRHGPVGYAIYFHCLELIAGNVDQNNITFELEHDAEIIADNLKVQGTSDQSAVEIVNSVMRYIVELGLFEEHDNRIFGFKLIKRLDSSMTSNPNFRDLIRKAKENHDGVMTGHDEVMIDPDTIMQEEKRLEQNRTEETSPDRADLSELNTVYLNAVGSPMPATDHQLARFLAGRFSLEVIRYELEKAADKRQPIRYIHAYMAKPDYEPPVAEVKEATRQQAREEFVETEVDPDMMDLVRRSGSQPTKVEVW